jgi:hypothetical protein
VNNLIRVMGVLGALGVAVAFFASQRSARIDVPDDATTPRPRAESPLLPPAPPAGSDSVVTETSPTRNEADSHEPTYAKPSAIEGQILQLIAEQRPSVLSVNSVSCGPTECEIAFLGADPNPRVVGAQANFNDALYRERWWDLRILSGSMGTREIAPGSREYVITFTYQPLVDRSSDPRIAARQEAACAAAWRRQTTNPTPPEVVRQYLAIAEQHLALAVDELGREEAARIARETNLGPLMRECGLQAQP